MITEIEYALMAGHAYRTTRDEINWFPIPQGWAPFFPVPDSTTLNFPTTGGFEAVSFKRNDEIVISYAGTYDKDYLGDWIADAGLATGVGSAQLMQAAEYYLQVKAANPDATITLTGHSLGGGLAALVGVFFGEQATTFDQAPFAKSAIPGLLPPDVAANLRIALVAEVDSNNNRLYDDASLAGLTNYLQLRATDGGIPNANLITNIRVDGEFLSSDFPLSLLNTIGTTAPEDVLTHGPTDISGGDLHSMALLTAFLQSDQSTAASGQTLREVSRKLTSLLGMMFDKNLFAYRTDDPDNRNLLDHLIRHEFGNAPDVTTADHMLDRFTSDLWKIAQDGGLTMANNDLTKALTAFAMQAYYDNRPESNATLFDAETGGIHFDRMDVADTLDGDTGAKGYTMYFTNYLNTLPAEDRALITAQLPDLLDWYIQAGNQAMNVTAGTQRAFMLGGSGDDTLTGGSQADVLVGNGGKDTLAGGTGNDLMIGGEGMDTYYLEGNDTIRDMGRNIIVYQGQVIAGAFLREGASNTYSFLGDNNFTLTFDSTAHLTVNATDSITFENQTRAADFANGDFGITLYDQEAATYVLNGSEEKDYPLYSLGNGNGSYVGVAFYLFSGEISGPYVNAFAGDSDWPMFAYSTYSTPPNLQIDGAGGDDYLAGLAGHDLVDGGDGNDRIIGDSYANDSDPRLNPWGNTGAGDTLRGEAGKDYISGRHGDDLISGGEDQDFLDAGNENDSAEGDGGNDVIAGGLGNDLLSGGTGDDFLYGDSAIKPVFPPGGYEDSLHPINLASMSVEATGYAGTGYPVSVIFHGFAVEEEAGAGGEDFILGGSGNDALFGGGGNDTLLGEADHDALIGGSGDDYLDGGDGNDWLVGDNDDMTGSGNDTLLGGDGDDLLYGLSGNDTLAGGSGDDGMYGHGGDDYLDGGSGSDFLDGGEGNDRLSGEAGDDYLAGGNGDDVYLFGRGFGEDTIHDSGSTGGGDTILFADDVASDDVLVLRYGNNLVLAIAGSGDQLLVEEWFASETAKIERVAFADGTVWDVEAIKARANDPLLGTSVGDILQSEQTGDIITDHVIQGTSRNEVLVAGLGDDDLIGGTGDDTYFLNQGFGHDIVFETDGYEDFDRIVFSGYIAPSDVLVYEDGKNLYLAVQGTDDVLMLDHCGERGTGCFLMMDLS